MVKENLVGQMVKSIQVGIFKIKNVVLEHLNGLMVEDMLVFGVMV